MSVGACKVAVLNDYQVNVKEQTLFHGDHRTGLKELILRDGKIYTTPDCHHAEYFSNVKPIGFIRKREVRGPVYECVLESATILRNPISSSETDRIKEELRTALTLLVDNHNASQNVHEEAGKVAQDLSHKVQPAYDNGLTPHEAALRLLGFDGFQERVRSWFSDDFYDHVVLFSNKKLKIVDERYRETERLLSTIRT